MIEEIVGLAENLQPIALIGTGGIGKTSIALKVLHHSRTKQRFGENRRFIRCDQFPATLPHFLSQLSKVTGAGIENPDSLTPLLPFLSSKEILIVLDNTESILDPQGTNAREIYTSVEELCRLDTICVCITSRLSTTPPDCETLDIPTLSIEAARDVFHRIYKRHGRSDLIDDILKQLEFHALSVTLLATIAQQNRWGIERLIKEWEGRRTETLQTEHRTSLGTTIELSLASPMFNELGPDARGLLGVIAFYPQGIDENNIDWLFPTISNRTRIFDKFCILSLTYRSDGFITMLAPLRDHFRPKDPSLSPLLITTKACYISRMSARLDPNLPGFNDVRWIVSEDVNVEHLLDIFASIDLDSNDIWNACINFMDHLSWQKPRKTILGRRIEGLPDNHHSKPECLFLLGTLSGLIGNYAEATLLLKDALKLERERENDMRVAIVLKDLSMANLTLGCYEEGIHQAREALGIYGRLGITVGRARCLKALARLLRSDGQLNAAEEAIVESINLLPEKGEEDEACRSHRVLGDICRSKGEKQKAIYHYEVALGIASTFDWRPSLFRIHLSLALLFLDEDELDDAQVHTERAKSHALDNAFYLGRAVHLQAEIWYRQQKFKDAASEALHAKEIFENLGNSQLLEICEDLLKGIEGAKERLPPSVRSDSNCKPVGTIVDPHSLTLLSQPTAYHPTPRQILLITLIAYLDHPIPERASLGLFSEDYPTNGRNSSP